MPILKKLVHINKVRIISVTEGIDSSRDGWEVVATIFSVMHERYIKDLSFNVFKGQEGAVLAGFCVGDYCFGYTSEPIPGSEQGRGRHAKPRMMYVVDEATASWVIRIFNWYVVDMRSLRWITRELNRRGAPKDHRATSKYWHHQQLADLLARKKYIGIWPWGKNRNDRNPLTGQVSQEERPAEECEKWTRKFPHLQIIADEIFEKAQLRLAQNKPEIPRQEKGKFAGSRTGNSATHPRHLLSGLLVCLGCGATLNVGGTGGKYLFCPNYLKGVCSFKTQVRRDRAERMILDVIGQRIGSNPAWHNAVHDEAKAAWKTQTASRPDEIQQTEAARDELQRKISRLVDNIEEGTAPADVSQRLTERRRECETLEKKLQQLKQQVVRSPNEPTAEWIVAKLEDLSGLLHGDCPAAALALRSLVGGQITVEEVREPDRKRFHARGRFNLVSKQVLESLDGSSGASDGEARITEEVVIDFVDPAPEEGIADQAKELWDHGMKYKEIARHIGCGRSLVTKAIAFWFRKHGQEPPDGRSCRKRLDKQTLAKQLADPAKALWDDDLLMQEIADVLECNRATVTAAIRHWFESRGLSVPDGRTRRKSLDRKTSRRSDPDQPDGQQG